MSFTSDRIARYRAENIRPGTRGPFESEIIRLGRIPSVQTSVERGTIGADTPVAAVFLASALPSPLDLIIRRRMMSGDGYPLQLSTGYVPASIAAGTLIEEADTGSGGTLARLAELGHEVVRHAEMVRTRPAVPDEAAFLHMVSRVLEVIHVGYDHDGLPVSVDVNVLRGDTILRYEW